MKTLRCIAFLALCARATATDFTFQNATIDWFQGSDKHTVPGKATNRLQDLFPEDGNSEEKTNVDVHGPVNSIDKESFQGVQNLATLHMKGVNLQRIEPGTFANLPNLERLYFETNDLEEIKSGIFVDLPCSYVFVSHNQISNLEVGAFKNLPKLNVLIMGHNKIETIKKGVFDNINFKILDLSYNRISKLEDGFLESVNRFIRPEMHLFLDDNKLEEVNPRALSHDFLSHLYLANNSISVLRPGDLQNLPKLRYIQLSGNKLKEIQEGIFNDSRLVEIDLSYNEISVVASGAFDEISGLQIVRLDHNKIKMYNSDWFKGSKEVSSIHVAHNLIEQLPEEAFKYCKREFSVDLANNRISNINPRAFRNSVTGTTRIHYLLLRDNLIESWQKSFLVNDADISVYGIDLRRNKLNCFEGGVDGTFGDVTVVWFSGNKFDESCEGNNEKYAKEHEAYEAPNVLTYPLTE